MFAGSRRRMCVTIGQACRAMGFAAPPVDRRTLRKRYIELAKKHHPDQSGPEASADRMVSVTEAYRTLRKLLDDGQRPATAMGARGGHGSSGGGGGGNAGDMGTVAASFVAPGVSLSTSGWTLPWQRSRTKSSREELERQLREETSSLYDYVRRVRAMEGEERKRAGRIKAEMKYSEGSHGFAAEHFDKIRRMQKRDVPWALSHSSLPRLVWKYYSQRLRRASGRWRDAVRYILYGC